MPKKVIYWEYVTLTRSQEVEIPDDLLDSFEDEYDMEDWVYSACDDAKWHFEIDHFHDSGIEDALIV